jgi:putative FmdB family regulatory protein
VPLYEYQCPKCGRFERIQKFADAPLTECPTCGSPVEKLLAAPAIQFKGTGWYITDYARKSDGKGKGKSEGKGEGGTSEGGKESGSSATSDSKATTSTGTGTGTGTTGGGSTKT